MFEGRPTLSRRVLLPAAGLWREGTGSGPRHPGQRLQGLWVLPPALPQHQRGAGEQERSRECQGGTGPPQPPPCCRAQPKLPQQG